MSPSRSRFTSDASLLIETLRIVPRVEPAVLAASWSNADTHALVLLAESEGAAWLLHRRLKALGAALASDAASRLAATAKRAAAQSLRVDAELAASLSLLQSAGIAAVPLKGAAMRRIADRVAYADSRASRDVDLIVPAANAQRGWDRLVAHGYTAPQAPPPDHHHLPALVGRTGVGVEIHLSTGATVDADEAWRRATTGGIETTFNGRSLQIPNYTELLWHAVTHAVGHAEESACDGIRIRHLIDGAALIAAGVEIDWASIARRLDSAECERPALAAAWIATAAELGGRTLPPGVLGATSAVPLDLERLLAWRLRVADASYPPAWANKLLEEGARGEAGLPQGRSRSDRSWPVRLRHLLASRAARTWWRVRR